MIFGGFSPDSVSDRTKDCDSRFVITADEGVRAGKTIPLKKNVDTALLKCPDVQTVFVFRHTGAPVTILHHAFVQQIHVPTRRTRIVSTAINLKDQHVQVARIQKLSLGTIHVRCGMVGVSDLAGLIHTPLAEGSLPFAGLLGGEILDRDHGIIDFGTRTLYLRK